jgi:hypothetical protein
MSESTIPFQGQTAVLDRPLTDLGEPVDEPGGGNRSKLLAFGALAGVLVLAVLAYFLFFAGGGEEPAAQDTPAAVVPQAPEAEQSAAVPAKSPKLTGKTFGRNPFKALITVPVAGTATTEDTTATTADTPSTSGSESTSSTGTTGSSTTTVPAASTAHRFKVVDVAPDNSRVSVKVDGKFYRNLKAGAVFADYFKVRFIGGAVNDFQYGEETFKVVGAKAVSIG